MRLGREFKMILMGDGERSDFAAERLTLVRVPNLGDSSPRGFTVVITLVFLRGLGCGLRLCSADKAKFLSIVINLI